MNFISRGVQFLREVRTELKKVTWPSKKEVQGTTVVVIVAVLFFGVWLSVADFLLKHSLRFLYELFGR